MHPQQDDFLVAHLSQACRLTVREAREKQAVKSGVVYLAPANYHLLIEADKTFSLSADEKVNFSRPSIDVLFETAAEAYGAGLIGVILTGASRDGAAGLRRIKEKEGAGHRPGSANRRISGHAPGGAGGDPSGLCAEHRPDRPLAG
jgi:two-component system chemotaxis response regulator CheB